MARSNLIEIAAVVVAGWIALEGTLRRGLVAGATVVGIDPLLNDYLVLAIGFPLVAVFLSRYALEQGQSRETRDRNWNPRALGPGILAAVVGFVLIAGASQIDAALCDLEETSGLSARD